MWFYTKSADAIETITHLESGAQVIQSGEGEHSEVWWRGNSLDAPLERDEMKLAGSDGERHFKAICDALKEKGDLAGYSRGVEYPIPGE